MKCPHCSVVIDTEIKLLATANSDNKLWEIRYYICSACHEIVLSLETVSARTVPGSGGPRVVRQQSMKKEMIFPKYSNPSISIELPSPYKEDFLEACEVLPRSPKASAALSRRCLQRALRQFANVTPGKLSTEIQQVVDGGKIQSDLCEDLNTLREIGNYAAHPNKDENTGEIIDVEPDEAEYTLHVLEDVLDYYIVRPIVRSKKRNEWKQKIQKSVKK